MNQTVQTGNIASTDIVKAGDGKLYSLVPFDPTVLDNEIHDIESQRESRVQVRDSAQEAIDNFDKQLAVKRARLEDIYKLVPPTDPSLPPVTPLIPELTNEA